MNLTYKNKYGETMQLKTNETNEILFKHSDCNENFETIIKPNNTLKFILSSEEKNILVLFKQMIKIKLDSKF